MVGVYLNKKKDKTIMVVYEHLTKNATGNSAFQIKTSYISLPSFLNPPRGSIYYLNYFWKGFSGSNFYNTLPTASFIQTLELDKRRCILSEIGPESIINFKLLQCIKLLLFSKLWVQCLVMVTVPIYPKWRWLMGEGPFVVIIQQKRGLLGFKLFCFLTAC